MQGPKHLWNTVLLVTVYSGTLDDNTQTTFILPSLSVIGLLALPTICNTSGTG